ncbi:3'-5' exonuclease [Agrobacterium radiobacter]|uniref:3'-5' exonuclease n=1 Tax=Agrobacterium radiobacter TaxID=362 RepID=UPI003C2F0FC3
MTDHDQNGEKLAQRLSLIPGFRILRELEVNSGVEKLPTVADSEQIAAVLDLETTGLNFDRDHPIELAFQRFIFDGSGNISAIEQIKSWREDPGVQIPFRLTQLTGLTAADLAGQRFADQQIIESLENVAVFIAHNAGFDRPFFDKRFPTLASKAWACTLTQVDWLSLGFDGRSLGYLLMQAGWFFQGHRAANDVAALTKLLALKAEGFETIFGKLLERSDTTSVCIDAVGAPFELKDLLKDAGYRWKPSQRLWSLETDEALVDDAMAWLEEKIYRGANRARLRRITARERFARDQ